MDADRSIRRMLQEFRKEMMVAWTKVVAVKIENSEQI